MEIYEVVGLAAAIITTGSYTPQIIKILKTKKADDISLLMYAVLVAGIILWLVYGFSIHNRIIIFANSIALTFSLVVIFLKFYYKK